MEMTQVRSIAKRIVAAHGAKAELEAAEKLRDAQDARDRDSIALWQRVRAVIREMKPPHES